MSRLTFAATELHKGFGPLWDPAAHGESKASAKTRLGKRFDDIKDTLDNQQYMAGEKFTPVDA